MPRARRARWEVVTDGEGWTWLRPSRRALRFRRALGAALAALAAIAAVTAAAAPSIPSVALAVAAVAAAAVGARAALRTAATRAAAARAGLLWGAGLRRASIAWPAVRELRVVPLRRGSARCRLRCELAGESLRTPAPVDPAAARHWLEAAERARTGIAS